MHLVTDEDWALVSADMNAFVKAHSRDLDTRPKEDVIKSTEFLQKAKDWAAEMGARDKRLSTDVMYERIMAVHKNVKEMDGGTVVYNGPIFSDDKNNLPAVSGTGRNYLNDYLKGFFCKISVSWKILHVLPDL